MFRALLCFCGGGQWAHGHVGASQSGLGLPPLPSLPGMASAPTPLPAMLPLLGIIQPRGSSHSGVASVLGRTPADSSQGRPRSSLTRPQHEPSPQTLGTPPTGPSLPPLMYSSLPGCLAMEPRLPDLASVSLGEGWGAGLLEPLWRERLASGTGWPWIPFTPWAGVRDGPHSQRERAPCWGIAQTEGSQGRR